MKAVFHPAQQRHDPAFFLVRGRPAQNAEQPERAERLLEALEQRDDTLLEAEDFGPGPRTKVHTVDYLDFLENAWAAWQELPDASPDVIPNIHPNRYPASRPTSIVGRAGFHQADTACPIGEHTYTAACWSAHSATNAAMLVRDQGERVAYAVCRPPGHHAFADMAGGFCFLNNSAIAAEVLRERHPRVAILDIDVHHGNGTQSIFYRRGDVLHVSIHADPAGYYPFFWGYGHETGEGDGAGATLNLPLAPGSDDARFLAALESALARIRDFAPGALVVALGLDAAGDDPLGILDVSADGFRAIAGRIADLGLPTVLVQEGGYLCAALGANLAAFLTGFEAGA